jgi:hypothetical protein
MFSVEHISIKISAKESLGYYEFKKPKPWLEEASSKVKIERCKTWSQQAFQE